MFSVKNNFKEVYILKSRSKTKEKAEFVNILDVNFDSSAEAFLPLSFCIENLVFPIKVDNSKRTIDIISKYPLKEKEKEYIKFLCGYEPVFYYVKDKDILDKYINDISKNKNINTLSDTKRSSSLDFDLDNIDSPAVQLVDSIFKEAINSKASDIHIEPFRSFYKVRLRVDGILREGFRLSKSSYNSAITRIKVLSKIDISEKRLPQDGRLSIKENNKLWDLRVSTMPTINGEKVVIRIFQDEQKAENIYDIGLISDNLSIIKKLLNKENGIILSAGPTGSGKSTTLYTLIRQLDIKSKNIITIEDPVEQSMEDIVQINVNQSIGFDFASGLRSILRQDPDVIMVGEIRDKETASIAMRSAITGHMVFSTIHTFDSASVIDRLLDMDIEPFMIASGLKAVISQRLVRKICYNCKVEYEPSDFDVNFLGITNEKKLFKGSGCDKCGHTGYYGRVGVFEVMEIKDFHREAILNKKGSNFINKISIENGMITLEEACKDLVRKGITTTAEVINICNERV